MAEGPNFVSQRNFKVTDKRDGAGLTVCIPEVPQASYGTYVWPCAPILARFLWYRRDHLRGRRVLEIGAGTALPGVVAAKCGAEVILSDTSEVAQPLEACRRSCEINGLAQAAVNIISIDWGRFGPEMLHMAMPDIILGSDCFYDSSDFEKVIATVYFFLSKNHSAVFWTTYQIRSDGARQLLAYLLERWSLRCTVLPRDLFDKAVDVDGDGRERAQAHDILLLEITSNSATQRCTVAGELNG